MSRFVARLRLVSPDLKLLWTAQFCLMFGFGIYSATYFNFATEVLRIGPMQIGLVESVRELPGFLCVAVAALTMRIFEPVLGSIALFLVTVGMGAYATVHGVPALLVWSLVWSVGFHAWMPVSSSLVLNLAGSADRGKRLGQTVAISGLGAALGMAVVMLVGYAISYPAWFLLGSCSVAVAAVTLLRMRRDIGHAEKPRMVWKRKYRLYYVLTFLEGCRKQVFFTFAIYALTKVYGTHLQTVALLMVINNVVNFAGGPVVGRLIDRIGEKNILMTSYSAVLLVFLGYATVRHAHMLYVLYCLDNLFYLSTTCLTTYLRRISEPQDLMPTLSLGITLNHTAAVLVPLIGGYLWSTFSYPVTFYGGAVVVAISLAFASRTGIRRAAEAPS